MLILKYFEPENALYIELADPLKRDERDNGLSEFYWQLERIPQHFYLISDFTKLSDHFKNTIFDKLAVEMIKKRVIKSIRIKNHLPNETADYTVVTANSLDAALEICRADSE